MEVEVCGVKYMNGIGKKSGKPYEAYSIYYTMEGKRMGFDGFVCGDAFISCSLLEGRPIRVGDKLKLFYDANKYLVGVEFCS